MCAKLSFSVSQSVYLCARVRVALQVRIVEEGAVPAIVNLLRSPVESMQEHAAVTLRNLSLNDDNEVRVVEEGCLPPLIAMLNSVKASLQLQSVGVLRNLSVKMENKLTMVQEGALPPLIRLLESPEEEVQLQVGAGLDACRWLHLVGAGAWNP